MRSLWIAAALVGGSLTQPVQAAPECALMQLPAPRPNGSSAAYGINNFGRVVGMAAYVDVGGTHATRWNGNTPVPLARPDDIIFSWARSINDQGQAAGYVEGMKFRPVVWSGARARELSLTGFYSGYAMSINNIGRVVGIAELHTDTGLERRAVVWRSGVIDTLLTPVGTTTEAMDINDFNQVVGNTTRADGTFATIWSGGAMRYLDFSGNSVATAINNAGEVVGYSGTPGARIATRWKGRTPSYLPSLLPDSYAYAVSNTGYIVGASGGRAVLWDGSMVVRDLNDCINPYFARAGWILTSAHGINDLGEIIGTMVHTAGTVPPRAFKLKTPFH